MPLCYVFPIPFGEGMKQVIFALSIFCCVLVFCGNVFAEGGKISLGMDAGVFHPIIDAGEKATFETGLSLCYGLYLAYGVSDHANIQVQWIYTNQRMMIDDWKMNMQLSNLLIVSKWYILTGTFRPLVSAGISFYDIEFDAVNNFAVFYFDSPVQDDSAIGPHLGLGVELAINKHVGCGISANVEYIFTHALNSVIGLSGLLFFNFTF